MLLQGAANLGNPLCRRPHGQSIPSTSEVHPEGREMEQRKPSRHLCPASVSLDWVLLMEAQGCKGNATICMERLWEPHPWHRRVRR